MEKRIATYYNTLPDSLKGYSWSDECLVTDKIRDILRKMEIEESVINDPASAFSLYEDEDTKKQFLKIQRNIPKCYDYSDKPMD